MKRNYQPLDYSRWIDGGIALWMGIAFVSILVIATALSGCATTTHSISTPVVQGLLIPVVARCDAYVAHASAMPPGTSEYAAAAQAVHPMLMGERVEGAAARPYVETICAFHDQLVKDDSGLDEMHRSTYLRSTQLLRKLFTEAATPLTSGP